MYCRHKGWFSIRFAGFSLFLLLFAGCTELIETPGSVDDRQGDSSVGEDAGGDSPASPFQSGLGPASGPGSSGDGVPGDGGSTDTLSDGGTLPLTDGGSSPTGCTQEGALRCVASGGAQREICRDGSWQATESCADDKVCDMANSQEPASCVDRAEFCAGKADTFVCVNGVMHECNTDGISISQQVCQSQAYCQYGLPSEQCAVCLPDVDHRCNGDDLEKCDASGTAYILKETCSESAPCNADMAACTDKFCLAGSFTCSGGNLLACNADETAFEVADPCSEGICDPAGGQCDICVAGRERKCDDSGRPAICDDEGQGWDLETCDGDTPVCVGQGVCVACDTDGDCGASTPVCLANDCVQCVTSTDCDSSNPAAWTCTDYECVENPGCGNGKLESGEQCDDGTPYAPDTWDGYDGCGHDCQIDTFWGCVYHDKASEWFPGTNQTVWVWTIPHPDVEDLALCAWPCGAVFDAWWPTSDVWPYEPCDRVDWVIPGTSPASGTSPDRIAECINGACVIPCSGPTDTSCPTGYQCKNPVVVDVDAWADNEWSQNNIPTTDEYWGCMAEEVFRRP